MKLYYAPGACSRSPHVVLRESGLPFSLDRVSMRDKKTSEGGDYLAINPKGQVPALVTDQGVLTEGPAIVQYVADRVPEKGLLAPVGDRARYRTIEWLNFVATELHKSFSPLFKPTTPEEWRVITRANLAQRYEYLDRELAGRAYLLGDGFTVADAYLFTILGWSPKAELDLATYPAIAAYVARVGERPSVREAIAVESAPA